MSFRATASRRARRTPSGLRRSMSRGLALMMSVLIVGPLLLVAVPARWPLTTRRSSPAPGPDPGLRERPRPRPLDGTGGVAEFKYEKNLGVAGGVPLTTWTFQSTAAQAGTVHLGLDARRPARVVQRHGRAVDVREWDPDARPSARRSRSGELLHGTLERLRLRRDDEPDCRGPVTRSASRSPAATAT